MIKDGSMTWAKLYKDLDCLQSIDGVKWVVNGYDINREIEETFPIDGMRQFKPGRHVTITIHLKQGGEGVDDKA